MPAPTIAMRGERVLVALAIRAVAGATADIAVAAAAPLRNERRRNTRA
jgi:hypothetical protein